MKIWAHSHCHQFVCNQGNHSVVKTTNLLLQWYSMVFGIQHELSDYSWCYCRQGVEFKQNSCFLYHMNMPHKGQNLSREYPSTTGWTLNNIAGSSLSMLFIPTVSLYLVCSLYIHSVLIGMSPSVLNTSMTALHTCVLCLLACLLACSLGCLRPNTINIWASVSEPHTSELNWNFLAYTVRTELSF